MLADHIGVHVLWIHLEVSSEERTKSRRVQRRARPEHTRVRHAELRGKLRRQVRHDVHRIRDDEQHRVGRRAEHRRDDLPEHVGVALQQLQSRFARLLRHAAGDDDHARRVEIGVLPRTDRQRVREGDRVGDVIGLGLGACPIHIHQHDLSSHAAHEERVGGCRSDHAAADDANLHTGPAAVISVLTPDSYFLKFSRNRSASFLAAVS